MRVTMLIHSLAVLFADHYSLHRERTYSTYSYGKLMETVDFQYSINFVDTEIIGVAEKNVLHFNKTKELYKNLLSCQWIIENHQ